MAQHRGGRCVCHGAAGRGRAELIMGAGIYVKGLKAWFGDALILKGPDLTVAPHVVTPQHRPVGAREVHVHPVPLKKLGS